VTTRRPDKPTRGTYPGVYGLVVGGMIGVTLATPTSTASAHATLIKANPLERSTLRVSPPRAQLWFSERLEQAYSTMSVWEDGRQVDRGDAAIVGDDARSLSVTLPALGRGTYLVKYRALSVDGHLVEGAVRFSVTGQAPAR
jgi:methionine-rich copper-binding protein CopC